MYKQSLIRAVTRGLSPLIVPMPMRLSEWADEHFVFPKESSYVQQNWKAYPFQPAMLDVMGNDEVEDVTVMKSARVGYTKMLLACLCFNAHHKKRNQGVWQPTDEDSDDFVTTELDSVLREIKAMRDVLPDFLKRNKNNTLKKKQFLGSNLFARGGKAAKNYRRLTLDFVGLDELDAFDSDVEKEGSPVTLARKRTEGATFPKMVKGSTPKLKHFSLIEREHDKAERRYKFHVPCINCGTYHTLEFGGKDTTYGMKWLNNDPQTVMYLCGTCHAYYTQADYLKVWSDGKWIDQFGGFIGKNGKFYDENGRKIDAPKSVAMHIWTAYSPQATWVNIVAEFLNARFKQKSGDNSEMKTFFNTTLGQTWEESVEKTDVDLLKQREGLYELGSVPYGCLILFAGVDVQDNRFEITVWGFGEHGQMWLIDFIVLYLDPALEASWQTLDKHLLTTTYQHASGKRMHIKSSGIDTGGHFTHQAYAYCRQREKNLIKAVKGDSKSGTPIVGRTSTKDVNWRGKIIPNGVRLWFVGTDTAKDLLFGRLNVKTAGPGYINFPRGLPEEFYEQLTSEVRALQKTASGEIYKWVLPGGKRNEVLDCTVYAIFAAHSLGVDRFTSKMWEKLRNEVEPSNGDLFAIEAPPSEQKEIKDNSLAEVPQLAPQVNRKKSRQRNSEFKQTNFVNRY